jgi:hypothetical protein
LKQNSSNLLAHCLPNCSELFGRGSRPRRRARISPHH